MRQTHRNTVVNQQFALVCVRVNQNSVRSLPPCEIPCFTLSLTILLPITEFIRMGGPFKPKAGFELGHPSFFFPRAQATSKRSWFITLLHAATKSFANFSFASEEP